MLNVFLLFLHYWYCVYLLTIKLEPHYNKQSVFFCSLLIFNTLWKCDCVLTLHVRKEPYSIVCTLDPSYVWKKMRANTKTLRIQTRPKCLDFESASSHVTGWEIRADDNCHGLNRTEINVWMYMHVKGTTADSRSYWCDNGQGSVPVCSSRSHWKTHTQHTNHTHTFWWLQHIIL